MVSFYVQLHSGASLLLQPAQSGDQQGFTESLSGHPGSDTQHIDLAELILMLLGPMEADHGALAHRNEETVWVEPRLSHSVFELGEVDQRLLRMIRKRRGVDSQPFLLVLSGYEGSDLDAGWDRRLGQLVVEPPSHDQQLALSSHPGGG